MLSPLIYVATLAQAVVSHPHLSTSTTFTTMPALVQPTDVPMQVKHVLGYGIQSWYEKVAKEHRKKELLTDVPMQIQYNTKHGSGAWQRQLQRDRGGLAGVPTPARARSRSPRR